MTLLGIVAFVVALLLSVVLHEAGHFVAARRFGMKATQFFVGFGPTLWSRRHGETEYGVKAIPAGGFVKIVGMTPLEEVEPGDEPRAFYRQRAGRKAVVLAAGSFVHFLIAVVVTVGAVLALGVPKEQAPAVASVSRCVAPDPQPGAKPASDLCTVPGAVPAPAAAAGLRAGDVVLSIDGRPVPDSTVLRDTLRGAAGRAVTLTVQRGDQRLSIPVTPAAVDRQVTDDNGRPVAGKRETAGTIGIGVRERFDTVRLGPVESLQQSASILGQYVHGVYTSVTAKLGTITELYGSNRDPQGFIGLVGAGRISADLIQSSETPAVKVFQFALLMAGLNLFVGAFNLLPLLPLDGGHLAVVGYENARDKLRRLRGYRGEFQPVDFTKLMPVTYAVVLLFVGLTLWIMGADIVNPIRLTQ